MDSPDNEEIRRYLTMDDDELYRLLVPEGEPNLFNDPHARVTRGKEIFVASFRRVQVGVCKEYRAHKDRIGNAIDMTALVASVVMAAPVPYGLPVIPFAVIVVKTGMAELCSGQGASTGAT